MKKIVLVFLFVFSALQVKAEDTVYLPCKKITNKVDKIVIEDKFYDSNAGYDFTGKGKPKFYDPMYSSYFSDYPPYSRLNTYPTFYLPALRRYGKK